MRLAEDSHSEQTRNRIVVAAAIVVTLFSVLFLRLWYLQIFQGHKYRQFSDQNRIAIKRIPAMRGRILDRNGVVIADSRPSFDLVIDLIQVKGNRTRVLKALAGILGWKDEEFEIAKKKIQLGSPREPVRIKRDLSQDELARFMVREYAFPGIYIVDSPARSYPFGHHGSHLLGYLGEINKTQLDRLMEEGRTEYQLGDVWGVAGIEKHYEKFLRGVFGARPFVEDARGREIGEAVSADLLPDFRRRDEVPGFDLVLTIDTKLQEAAEGAFTYPAGALVAMNPQTGDVLALVSRPEFEPQNFVRGVSSDYWGELQEDPLNPLYDRALRSRYPPGSTFKFVMGMAIQEEKIASPSESVFCGGSYRLGREVKRCWKPGGHGWMNLHSAIVHSCDVYFYEMGRRLGIERIAKAARKFGFGSATGIGINRERPGLVPDEAWKRRVYNQPWVGGETLSVAIGQGALEVTPLQMTTALSALVNGGRIFRPRIVMRAQTREGEPTEQYKTAVRTQMEMDPLQVERVRAAMDGVVNEVGGTAYWTARSQLVRIAGKTGTAQVVNLRSTKKLDHHAWFVAYAPSENPTLVISLIVENAGHGGDIAAPIVKKVIETYLGEPS